MTSVRLGLIRLLLRIVDKIGKDIPQDLRGYYVHPQSCANMGLGLVLPVDNRLCQGQVQNTVNHAALGNQAGHNWRNAVVDNKQLHVANVQRLTAANNDLIRHQNLQPLNDAAILHAQQRRARGGK